MVDIYQGGAMSLNIKNDRVCELAKHASERTGLSQTAVIGEALAAYLAALPDVTLQRRRTIDEFLAEFDAATTEADVRAMRRAVDTMYDYLEPVPE